MLNVDRVNTFRFCKLTFVRIKSFVDNEYNDRQL